MSIKTTQEQIKELKPSYQIPALPYLDTMVELELMHKIKPGRDSYYINFDLMQCLSNVNDL